MPTARHLHGVTAVEGKVYVVGGVDAAQNKLASVEEYDTLFNTWRSLPDLPAPRSNLGVVGTAYGPPFGKIYAIGGLDNSGNPVDTLFEYDLGTSTWTPRKALPAPRADFAAAADYYGRIYVFGGLSVPYDASAVLVYEPWTDAWTTLDAPMPRPRARAAAVRGPNSRIYLLGGDNFSGSSQGPIAEVDVFDTYSRVWLAAPPMPTAASLLGATEFNYGIYAIGGGGEDNPFNSLVQHYAPDFDYWTLDTPMPAGRTGLGVASAWDPYTGNRRLFAIGGYDGLNVLNTVVEGTLLGQEYPTPTPTATPTAVPSPTVVPTVVPGQDRMAVAYQVNPAHDGNMQAAAPVGPLAQKWSVDLGNTVSYPLIARGKVFATVSNPSGYGTTLHALNATDGTEAWTPVDLGGTYWSSGIAYDDGRIFTVNFDGVVRAFDAGTGQQLWRRELTLQYAFTSPPTALQGVLYLGGAGSGGTLFALDAVTGADRWVKSVTNGDHSSPALSQDGVFVSYSCPNVFKFDRWTGGLDWLYTTGCSGGGGRTPVYYDGKLYVRDAGSSPSGYIFSEQSNTVAGRFYADPAPAFANGLGYFVNGGYLTARNMTTGSDAWTYQGDGGLSTAPIVAGANLYVASRTGTLHVVNATTGQQLWTAPLPAGVAPPDEHNVSKPLTGLNAGEELLVVPAENHLVAFGSATP